MATVYGDVHDIGKSLLITILSNNGYTVHDLGKQVPVNTIVEAAIDKQADAIGLSALLVSTSKQMPLCIQELDHRGVHLPVLIGGAAINRAFGRRAAVLPDGRVYEPAVFYCKDVFEGLSTMDALVDQAQRSALIEQVRAEIAAERDRAQEPAPLPRVTPRPGAGPRRDVTVPVPPFWGARRVRADLREVWRGLDRNTLFRHHWGGHRAKGAEYERIVQEVFEPELASLTEAALAEGWLEALIVTGYFPCNAAVDQLVVFDPVDAATEVARLEFPRQPDGERLCLADYFPTSRVRPTRRRRSTSCQRRPTCGPVHRGAAAVGRLQSHAVRERPGRRHRRSSGRVRPQPGPPRPGPSRKPGPALQLGLRRVSRPGRAAKSSATFTS